LKKRSGKTVGRKKRTRVRLQPSNKAAVTPCNAVFLVGFMGAGKSSVGRALGQRLNWVFEDLDDRIERREGRTVGQIFDDSGEPEFRRAEHAALRHALEDLRVVGARIIALGGGAFVQEKNAALLVESGAATVFLDAPVDELWQRCRLQAKESGAERPLLGNREQFRQLYDSRRRSYAKASVMIQTGNRPVDAIADQIVEMLGLKRIGIRVEQGEAE
jgi:shikimate kinase